jgi:hypothetical protein
MPLLQKKLPPVYNAAFARKSPKLVPAGDTSGQVPALLAGYAPSAPVAGGGAAAPTFGGGPVQQHVKMGEELGPFGVQPPSLGGATARWASWAPTAPQKPIADIVKAAHVPALSADPQLPQHPLGAYTDSEYEASNAQLEQQINAAYQDVLSQTGYTGPGGEHIAGDVELQAARTERDQLTNMMNAANEVTGQMQQAGTIFSGYHASERARAEQPSITALGDLAVDTPRTLTRLYQQAEDLMRQYAVSQNLLLMQAAQRRAAALALMNSGTGAGAGAAPAAPVAAPAPFDYQGSIVNPPWQVTTPLSQLPEDDIRRRRLEGITL